MSDDYLIAGAVRKEVHYFDAQGRRIGGDRIALGPQLTPEQARWVLERVALPPGMDDGGECGGVRAVLSLIAERGGTECPSFGPTDQNAATHDGQHEHSRRRHTKPGENESCNGEARMGDIGDIGQTVPYEAALRIADLEAEVEKLRSFPPCCYDDLGNEGRGCQLLTDAQMENEKMRDQLRGIHQEAKRARSQVADVAPEIERLEGRVRTWRDIARGGEKVEAALRDSTSKDKAQIRALFAALNDEMDRAEAAEAEVEKLRGALEHVRDKSATLGDASHRARAALASLEGENA